VPTEQEIRASGRWRRSNKEDHVAYVPAASPTGYQAEPSTVPVAMGIGDPARRVERLAPLIHQLVAWDLIYRSDAGTFAESPLGAFSREPH